MEVAYIGWLVEWYYYSGRSRFASSPLIVYVAVGLDFVIFAIQSPLFPLTAWYSVVIRDEVTGLLLRRT